MDVKKIQSWLSGEQLRSDFIRKQYKLLALIAGLFFIYIFAGYNSMKQQRRLSDLKNEVKTAKFEYLTISAELAEQTRQSKIGDKIEEEGRRIKENREPVIMIKRRR